MDKAVFGVAAAAALAFVLWGALTPAGMGETTTSALTWLEKSFGWLIVLTTASFVVFSGYLALSRYGNIKLGPDDSVPEFSTIYASFSAGRDPAEAEKKKKKKKKGDDG